MAFKILDKNEFMILESFSEVIIPSGSDPAKDPGAKDTCVVEFIDRLLDNDKVQVQKAIKSYLKELNRHCLKSKNKSFTELEPENQKKFLKLFEKSNQKRFSWLKRMVMGAYYSNYQPEGYQGVSVWQTIGYLGPMTWAEMTWDMSNPVYEKEQEVKEAVQL